MFNSIQQFETEGIRNLRKAEDEFIRTKDDYSYAAEPPVRRLRATLLFYAVEPLRHLCPSGSINS